VAQHSGVAEPIGGTLGSSGRNILDGRGGGSTNLSIFKNVQLREGLQLCGEFFNLFNRVNFGFPGSTVGTPGYGVIQSAGDARMVQIGLKLAF
jgi:hypothetical protein